MNGISVSRHGNLRVGLLRQAGALVLACLALAATGCAASAPAPTPTPYHAPPGTSTTPSIPSEHAYMPPDAWLAVHRRYARQASAGGIDLLFLGDSITYYWPRYGARVWNRIYAPMKAAAFGIPGDETQHLLWRVEHDELRGLHPKVVVLMIGTNNLGSSGMSPRETASGVRAVVRLVRAKLPRSQIVLMGLLPRYNTPSVEAKIPSTNALIARIANGKTVHYLDITSSFTRPDGSIVTSDLIDGVHPSEQGYRAWATAMKPLLNQLWNQVPTKKD